MINKKKLIRYSKMLELQNDILNKTISDMQMLIDDNSEDDTGNSDDGKSDVDIPKFNERCRKRDIILKKGKNKDINSYEIENIVNHKIDKNIYLFEVKWREYSIDDNT